MSEVKQVYLNVKPLCKEPQLIHIESIVGFNVAIIATFECTQTKNQTINVKNIHFEIYPMFGRYILGFKNIKICKEYQKHKERDIETRVIEVELGLADVEYSCTITPEEDVIWCFDDIIDNKISFNLFGNKIESRENLKALFEGLDIFSSFNEQKEVNGKNIPRNGRPCQFKLVKEL